MDKWFCDCMECGNVFLVDTNDENDEYGVIGLPVRKDGELFLNNYCMGCLNKFLEEKAI